MMEFSLLPVWVTLKLALITTVFLLLIGVPLAWWLASSKRKGKIVAEALVAMPLVLPPSVLGFYLLMLLSQDGPIGGFFSAVFDVQLAFSFPGLVIGSVLHSLPFMVHPVQAGLEGLPKSFKEAAYTLGKSRWQTFRHVLLPNIKRSLLSGIVLSFAHTIGEFGVVLLIGGNLPETRVASIEIYNLTYAGNTEVAHYYSFILFAISFAILLVVYFFNRYKVSPWK